MLFDKEAKLGKSLITNEDFLLGFLFGMFSLIGVGFGFSLLIIGVTKFKGLEADAFELLLKLSNDRDNGQNDNNASKRTESTRSA